MENQLRMDGNAGWRLNFRAAVFVSAVVITAGWLFLFQRPALAAGPFDGLLTLLMNLKRAFPFLGSLFDSTIALVTSLINVFSGVFR